MRCAAHDLACGPDGRCVLCRRSLPPGYGSRSGWTLAFAIVGAGAIAIAAIGVIGRIRSSPEPTQIPIAVEASSAIPMTRSTEQPTAPSADPFAAIEARDREERIQRAMGTVEITVYTTSWCPECRQMRAWLSENRIAFTEHDIERDRNARAAYQRSGANAVPLIDIEGNVRIGFEEDWVLATRRRIAEGRVAR